MTARSRVGDRDVTNLQLRDCLREYVRDRVRKPVNDRVRDRVSVPMTDRETAATGGVGNRCDASATPPACRRLPTIDRDRAGVPVRPPNKDRVSAAIAHS